MKGGYYHLSTTLAVFKVSNTDSSQYMITSKVWTDDDKLLQESNLTAWQSCKVSIASYNSSFLPTRTSEWKADWLRGWLTESLIDWAVDWLSGWLTERLIDWVVDWLRGWLTEKLIDWEVDWLSGWLTERLIDWEVGWLTELLIDWAVDWLRGWMTDRLIDRVIDWQWLTTDQVTDWLFD